jgi:serine/threonine-protein phosphatase 2A regulatory subunit B'
VRGSDRNKQTKESKENFLKKVQFCSQVFDFNDESKMVADKNERLKYMGDLSDLLMVQSNVINLVMPHLDQVMEMIQKNIFRPLPVVKKTGVAGEMGIDEEEIIDPSWPHLQPVYEFFLQLIVNDAADVKSLKGFITHKFIQEFLELFDSEEPKEREYLKNILHRLYAKLVPRRKMIRKAITDTFYTLIHENYKFNGAPELLDILASIISGFAVPLRDEHVYFFKTVIIPLHKVQTHQKFHNELLRCSMLFVSKDPLLAFPLVEGLLKYWPFANFSKESLFLQELLEVLDVCDITKLEPLIERLFKRLIKCISSPHLQVSDRAMCFFENDFFQSILKNYKAKAFPILVPVIVHLAENHWHKLLQDSLYALKSILKDIDPHQFEKALSNKDAKYMYLVKDVNTLKKEREV